jgi:5-methylcytosine-specific restriction enzyme subunit McrC
MNGVTIYEFDSLIAADSSIISVGGLHSVPPNVFSWLELQCLRASELGDAAWLRLTQRRGRRAIQMTNYVGVVRAPDGFQIEVLPKIGKAIAGDEGETRQLLIEMLCCLGGFRHIQTGKAKLDAARMPLLEVFIAEFLREVEHVVKRGMRGDYIVRQGNVFALRGKLLSAAHLRHNLHRADRFFTAHDELSFNRAENRLLHSALRRALVLSASQANQQRARELEFVFAEVPLSKQPRIDFKQVRFDRGMNHYVHAMSWARLLLEEESPLTGAGGHSAPSLMFPMESVFEAFVAKHLAKQLMRTMTLKAQAFSRHLVRHLQRNWFRLKPDLLVGDTVRDLLVLDTKWKLLDGQKSNGSEKYGLSQSDFYQMYAYGQSYLNGAGDVVLIYPKTDSFDQPLPVFNFPKNDDLRLWVVPFCLKSKRVIVTANSSLARAFNPGCQS